MMRLIIQILSVWLFIPLIWVSAADHPEVSSRLTLFFSGDVRGNFEPCGCSAGPTGGLSRRAAHVREFKEEHPERGIIQVDAGNYFSMPSPASQAINSLMLESLERLPLEVINLGREDLYWWTRLDLDRLPATRAISTNAVLRRSGQPEPAKYAVVEAELRQGETVRIGFLGLVDPARVKPNSGFRGLDPLQAVAEIKEEVLARSDFLIVLADWERPVGKLPEDSVLVRLAESHDEIGAIITTERRFILHPPQKVNSAIVLSSVERGRYLGQLTFGLSETKQVLETSSEFIELKDGVPEDREFLEDQERVSRYLP